MYIPRWILISVMVAVATVGGWALHGVATERLGMTTLSAGAPAESADSHGAPTNVAVDGGNSAPVINLSIDDPADDTDAHPTEDDSELRSGDSGRSNLVRAYTAAARPASRLVGSATGGVGSAGAGGDRVVYVNGIPVGPSSDQGQRESTVVHHETLVTNDSRITVNGTEIVVASDGSIVFQGDNGSLNGNTGDSSSSGSIAIDNNGSTVSTGTSGGSATATTTTAPTDPVPAGVAELATAERRASGATEVADAAVAADEVNSGFSAMSMVMNTGADDGSASTRVVAPAASLAAVVPETDVDGLTIPPTSPLWGWSLNGVSGRAVSISGYEDHSITVDGNDQIILYDDSNVFIDRNGQVNANTGDTDSSGLNVVDAVDSIVRSGNSGDGEGSGDDDEDEAEDEDEPPAEGLPLASISGQRSTAPASTSMTSAARSTMTAASAGRASGSVDDEDTTTSASGDDALIIGGDGYDDLAVRSRGNRNIVVYDDSNLVIGGAGGVNAQIGDSDTAGAVVMGVRNSIIEAGCEGDLCPLYRN